MKIVTDGNIKDIDFTAVAIGNFDGLHIGHQSLIENITEIAKDKKLKSVVCTFNNHTPQFTKKMFPKVLMNENQRNRNFKKSKVDFLYVINFNEYIIHLSPTDFVEKILIGRLHAKFVVVGFNFRFGYKAEGDVHLLQKLGEKFDFKVLIIPPVCKNDRIVSSTAIRELIKEGKIELSNSLLDKPYSMRGRVVSGMRRGKTMAIPTANLTLEDNYIIPKHGVYKTITNYKNKKFLSITNIGYNPTFGNDEVSIETHIFDFTKEIYDEIIEVSFIEFIREEIKFDSKDTLIKQMKTDIKYVKQMSN